MPSRRPDIFPEFDKPERVFLPKPLPGDPAMPDEELEESVKRTTPGDPDPEHKTGEPVSERAGERTNERPDGRWRTVFLSVEWTPDSSL